MLPQHLKINEGNNHSLYEDHLFKTKTPTYNTIRDNQIFNQFAVNYNKKLVSAFEEVDKLNNSGS